MHSFANADRLAQNQQCVIEAAPISCGRGHVHRAQKERSRCDERYGGYKLVAQFVSSAVISSPTGQLDCLLQLHWLLAKPVWLSNMIAVGRVPGLSGAASDVQVHPIVLELVRIIELLRNGCPTAFAGSVVKFIAVNEACNRIDGRQYR